MKASFIKKIADGTLVVGVVGLGYVGLPLAEAFIRKGVKVVGFDVNDRRVEQLNSGRSGMDHISNERVQKIIDSKICLLTADPGALGDADAIMICVPTPLDNYHHPDLSYVESTCRTLKDSLRQGQLIILESTTFPGTTEEIMKPLLQEGGLKAGEDFALAYSPEREDPGNVNYETSTIPKLVGADSDDEREMADAVYSIIVETVLVPNTRTAEAAKLTENIFRWVNIALINELKLIFEKMNIDIWDVVKAADSKPFGYMAFHPGPGVGGHCIRVDPYYLTWKAREHGLSTRFIELAGEINIQMPKYVVNKLMEELNLRQQKALARCKILVCGVAYKRNVSDIRESPALDVLTLLEAAGADVDYIDSYIPQIPPLREFPQFTGRESIEWSEGILRTYDAAIIITDHTNFDYEALVRNVPLVVDTRNITSNLPVDLRAEVVKA